MGKHNYFELSEFINSATAKKKGIDNSPSFEVVDHLSELVDKLLDPLRAAYGMPIRITSGYRCPELNKAVGGVPTSAHLTGDASDIASQDTAEKLFEFTRQWLEKTGVKFDQLILEENKKTGTRWVHIGRINKSGQQRGQIKKLSVE